MREPRTTLFADAGPGVGLGHVFRSYALFDALNRSGAAAQLLVPLNAQQLAELGIRDARPVAAEVAAIQEAIAASHADELAFDTYRHMDQLLDGAGPQLDARFTLFDDHYRVTRPVRRVINASPAADAGCYEELARYLLLGPAYAAMHRAFRNARDLFVVRQRIERILVALGGEDSANGLPELLAVLVAAVPDTVIIDVIGRGPPTEVVAPNLRALGWLNQDQLARLMSRCDLAVLGGGSMLLQAATVGLPVIAWPQTSRQQVNALAWERLGVVIRIAGPGDLAAVYSRMSDPAVRRKCADCGRAHSDGEGAQRIASHILQHSH